MATGGRYALALVPVGVISGYVRQLLINIDIPTSEVVKCLFEVLQVDRMISLLRGTANRNYLGADSFLGHKKLFWT